MVDALATDAGSSPAQDIEMALLDAAGTIVATNEAWQEFTRANGGEAAACGVGASYLAVCDADSTDEAAGQVAAAIRRAATGDVLVPVRVLMPCHSPTRERWFEALVSSRFGDDGACAGACVALVPLGAGTGSEEGGRSTPMTVSSVLDALPDGVLVVDRRGLISHVNRELVTLSGHSARDLVGEPVEVLVPTGAQTRHRRLTAEFLTTPRTRDRGHAGRLLMRCADGAHTPVEVSLAEAAVDGLTGAVAVVRDLRPRERLEGRLALVADLLDSVGDAIVAVDLTTGRPLYANRALLDAMGASTDDLDALTPEAFGGPQAGRAIGEALGLLAGGRQGQVTLETWIRPVHGAPFPVEMLIAPLASSGDATGPQQAVIIARDISARRDADTRLRAGQDAFRAAFERAPVGMGVFRVDATGRREVIRANDSLARLLGVTQDVLEGVDFARFVAPDDTHRARENAIALAHGLPAVEDNVLRHYERPDGRTVWAEIRATPIPDAPWTTMAGDAPGTEQDAEQQDIPDPAPGPLRDEGAGAAAPLVGRRRMPPSRVLLAHFLDVTERVAAEERRRRRAALADMVARTSEAALAGRPSTEVHRLVVDQVTRLFAAEHVALSLPDGTGRQRLVAVTGPLAGPLLQGRIPVDQVLMDRVARSAGAARFHPPPAAAALLPGGVGPAAAVPFRASPGYSGAMTVVRPPGAAAFTDADLELLTSVGHQLALVVELAAARADQERLALLDERQRIARDLHDVVLQDLIAIGLQLENPGAADDADLLEQLETVVRTLRALVLDYAPPPRQDGLAASLRVLCRTAARALGFTPALVLRGPVETLPEHLGDHVVAVVQECLSNTARHADARHAAVRLTVSGHGVRLRVDDDGSGLPDPVLLGNGLTNIRARAAAVGGSATIRRRPGPAAGTTVVWTAPRTG